MNRSREDRTSLTVTLVVTAAVLALASFGYVPSASAVLITEFPLPSAGAGPAGTTTGPDGNVWFAELTSLTNSIGRIEVHSPYTITEFTAPTAPSGVLDVTTGPDGNLWFVESQTYVGDRVARMLPTSPYAVTEFPFSSPGLHEPDGITVGSDGNMWVANQYGESIARILVNSPNTITEFPAGSELYAIASGSDGNLWFSFHFFDRIGRIEVNSPNTITEFDLPTHYPGALGGATFGIVSGPDGNIWFVEVSNNQIGRIEVNSPNIITEFPIPTANSGSYYEITAGSDGNLWFTETNANQIARIEVNSPNIITEFPIPTANSQPSGISAGSDGNLWFTELSGNKIGRLSGFARPGEPCVEDSNCESDLCVGGTCSTLCGNGVLEPGEVCDLGPSAPNSGNCPVEADPPTCTACTRSCSSTCQLVGRCTGSAGCCLAASDCPPGEGCCGNGTTESGEVCDDGNLVGGDTCTPQCVSDTGIPFTCCRPGSEVAGGTVLIGQKLKLNKLTAPAGDDKFTSPGETILLPGQDIHPCTEGVSYCLEGDDGIVYGPTPGDGFAISGSAFGPKPPCLDQSVPDRRVRAIFKDKTLQVSEPAGLSRVQIRNVRSQPNKYKFKVQGKNVDLSAATGATRLRQTLVVGDTCMTLNLTCVDKSGGKTKVCTPAP